jgi:hypothetical protein
LGVARTGRVVTAAALVMSVSFAALIAAHVSFMRMFGVGLTLAVVVDATLVRMVLLPAFMHVLGTRCWWAPTPLAALQSCFTISDGHPVDKARHRSGRHRISKLTAAVWAAERCVGGGPALETVAAVRRAHRAHAPHPRIPISGANRVELVAASNPIDRRMLNDRVIDLGNA